MIKFRQQIHKKYLIKITLKIRKNSLIIKIEKKNNIEQISKWIFVLINGRSIEIK